MKDFYFGIPTYKRAGRQRTLEYFESLGINKERLIMSVQTAEDRAAYAAAGYDKRVGRFLYRSGDNLSDNLNTILDSIEDGDRIIMVDDDIKSIDVLQNGKLVPIERKDKLLEMIEYGYGLAEAYNTIGFSIYPCHNEYFMKNSFSDRCIGEGTFLALTKTKERFNRRFSVKMDYEFTLRAISKYGHFIRLNNYAANAPHFSAGGCEDFWQDKIKNYQLAKELCERFPTLVRMNEKRKGEIKMKPQPKEKR